MGKGQTVLNKEMIKLISEIASATAIDQYKKEQEEKAQKERDHRLHNVKLLLRNYRKFSHVAEKVEDKITEINHRMVLDAIDLGELIVPSIKKSKERTLAIVRYMNRTLEFYKDLCEQEGELGIRKYETIHFMYLSKASMSASRIAQHHQIVESAVYKNANKAYDDLAGLLFGIDYLKLAE